MWRARGAALTSPGRWSKRAAQERTVSAWGDRIQADFARLRFLVVGGGSVGLDVALRLAATGVLLIAVMDFDGVEIVNLDRLIGATRFDALLHRSKAEVALRLMRAAATAAPDMRGLEMSVCTPEGLAVALDYDVIISCVDRPWPRAVLNGAAYADLIPVVHGGIGIDPFEDGKGMRGATWRSHVIRPGRPYLACNGQLVLGDVQLDRQGLLDDLPTLPPPVATPDRPDRTSPRWPRASARRCSPKS